MFMRLAGLMIFGFWSFVSANLPHQTVDKHWLAQGLLADIFRTLDGYETTQFAYSSEAQTQKSLKQLTAWEDRLIELEELVTACPQFQTKPILDHYLRNRERYEMVLVEQLFTIHGQIIRLIKLSHEMSRSTLLTMTSELVQQRLTQLRELWRTHKRLLPPELRQEFENKLRETERQAGQMGS